MNGFAPPRGSRWRRSALITVALAALAALLVGFRPSLTPPGLHARGVQIAAAREQLLVDSPNSLLTNDGESTEFESEVGAQIALSYVLYLRSNAAAETIGRNLGLGRDSVQVSGPFTLLLNRVNYPHELPSLPDPRTVNSSYRLLADVDGVHPMLTLYAQAPTLKAAESIIADARELLKGHVTAQEEANHHSGGTPVVLRALGDPTGGVVDPQARWQLMVLAFVLTLLLVGSLFFAGSRRIARKHDEALSILELDRLDDESAASDDWPHTRRALPWALAGFMAMLFLVPFDSINLPLHLPVNGTLDRPVLIAMTLLWASALALLSGAARPRVRFGKVHLAVLAFFAVCLLSVALNAHALSNMNEVELSVKKLALLISYIVFFCIAASVLRPREVARFAALMVGLGVIVALGTIVEYRWHYNVFYELWGKVLPVTKPPELDKIDPIGRLTVFGPTLQPLELAAMLSMVLPFAILGAIDAPTKRRRMLYTVAIGVLIAGGVATARKSSLVIPAAVIVLLACYRPRDVLRTVGRLAVVLFVIVHFLSPGALGSVISQLEPGHINGALTTTDRTARYGAVMPDLLRHPVIGRGYESYDPQKYRILDNQYLDLLITVGVIGTVLYVLMFGAMIGAARPLIRDRSGHDPRRSSLALAAVATVVAIAIGSALFDVLSFPHVPYMLFFVAAMILALREPSPAPEPVRLTSSLPLGQEGPPSGTTPPDPEPLEVLPEAPEHEPVYA